MPMGKQANCKSSENKNILVCNRNMTNLEDSNHSGPELDPGRWSKNIYAVILKVLQYVTDLDFSLAPLLGIIQCKIDF